MLALALLIACGAEPDDTGPVGTVPDPPDTDVPDPTPPDTDVPEDTGITAPIEVDCTDACANTSGDAGWARCYSCRCKEAMDGWLPSTAELQCSNGAEIVVYSTDADGALTPVTTNVTTCANPTLLYGTCKPGGRLGQLTHGDITAKWICRRNAFVQDAVNQPDLPYDDVGAILYNARTGASCWFDDVDGTGLAGENWPDMDLSAPGADISAYQEFFYNTDGASCTGCHDNDPFNYSPYLQSVGWVAGSYTFGGYSRIALDGSLDLVDGVHLVSPDAAACTACHRIASESTCGSWAADSLGLARGGGSQQALQDAIGDPTSPLWPLLAWMPYENALDPDAWEAQYGLARDTVTRCCAQPGVQTAQCQWEPNF